MDEGPARQSVALALLAVLTGAIVQIASTEIPFTPWHSIVGLIMVATAQAYGDQIARKPSAEAIAFAMILAAGILFSAGFVLDQLFAKIGLVFTDASSGKQEPGFLSAHLEDDVYFLLWSLLTAVIFIVRAVYPRSNGG